MTLEHQYRSLACRIDTALNRCKIYLQSQLQHFGGELVFVDQPDQAAPYLGTYGASCAAIALLSAGMEQNEPLVRSLLKYLCTHQMESGGWTIRNAREVGLTTACAFSVMAFCLGEARTDEERSALDKGLEWLRLNATSDGWPYYEGGKEVAAVPTFFAVRALNRAKKRLSPPQLAVLNHGWSCVEKWITSSGYVCVRGDENRGSPPATAIALLSLIEGGYPRFNELVVRSVSWVKSCTSWRDDNTDSFYAYGKTSSGHVNYVHFTPALMIQALLACEDDVPAQSTALKLLDHLLASQTSAGDWRSELAARETPTWMEMDAALALSSFSKKFATIQSTLWFRDEIARVDSDSAEKFKSLAEFSLSLASRNKVLENIVSQQQSDLASVSSFLKFVRAAYPFIPAALILMAYSYVRLALSLSQPVVDIGGTLVSVIGLVYGFMFSRKNSAAAIQRIQLTRDSSEAEILIQKLISGPAADSDSKRGR